MAEYMKNTLFSKGCWYKKNKNLEPVKAVDREGPAAMKVWAYCSHEESWENGGGLSAGTILTLAQNFWRKS